MLGHAKRRSTLRSLPYNLNLDVLLDMLLVQEGRCFYSGVPIECVLPHSHWRMSLERFDNNDGYVIGNCALIANEFNSSDHSSRSTSEARGSAQWSKTKV